MVRTGATVVLTRSQDDNASLRAHLHAAGVNVIEVPTAALRDVPPEPDVDTVRTWCTQVQAVAFTSRHGVEAFCRQIGSDALRLARDHGAQIAAVGQATAGALHAACVGVDIAVAEPATGEHLAFRLADDLEGTRDARVLAVQGRHARPELLHGLQRHGIAVDIAVVYENAVPEPPAAEILLACASADLIYVAAPSAADRLLAWAPGLRDRPFVVIGPTTAAELQARHGLTPAAIAAAPAEQAVLAAIVSVLELEPPCLAPESR